MGADQEACTRDIGIWGLERPAGKAREVSGMTTSNDDYDGGGCSVDTPPTTSIGGATGSVSTNYVSVTMPGSEHVMGVRCAMHVQV